jgi:formylglycine-generating enzyme required for sulfatase activity
VGNERNEVKPDRVPRDAQIAKTCMSCHDGGCPKTREATSCQKCHHVHALVNPTERRAAADERLTKLLERWERFRRLMDEGDRLVRIRKWEAARNAFRVALDLIPGNHRATTRLAMCERRIAPELPGFEIIGDDFDTVTGLPPTVTVAELGTAMVLIPAGEFDMGDDSISDARPVHTVAVEPFYLGKFEMTQVEWNAVMGTNPSVHQGPDFADRERMPVENVSWDDCQVFVRRLNERMPGGGFRLPTEAEWEYACRAASPRPDVVGQAARLRIDLTTLARFAWFRDNSTRQADSRVVSQQADGWRPQPVGTKQPNRWGLNDMQGNVSEWCSTLYRPYLYDPEDGRESLVAPGLRVLRGGGFADSAESLDPAARHAERPQRRSRWNGLRVARSVPK